MLGTHVLFNDGWVPYAERADWLLDADVALSCQPPHLETRFSFRTRYLDCFWAGLPLVVTAGDELADRIARDDLGAAVPPEDPGATADALEAVLSRGRADYADRLAAVADEFRWSRATRPLREIVTGAAAERRTRSRRRPGHAVRDFTYCTARSVLNRVGLRDWPPQ